MDKPMIRCRDSADVNKNIEYIAPEEIMEAAMLVLEREYSIPKDSLVEQTANLLGIQRVTEDISKYIWKAIKGCKREQKIVDVNGRLTIITDTK